MVGELCQCTPTASDRARVGHCERGGSGPFRGLCSERGGGEGGAHMYVGHSRMPFLKESFDSLILMAVWVV